MSSQRKGAVIWSAVYALLLVSLITPFSLLTMSFIMVPLILLYIQQSGRTFVVCLGIVLLLFYAVFGSLATVFAAVSFTFLPAAIVMAQLYRRKKEAGVTLLTGTVTLMSGILIVLAVSLLAGVNIPQELKQVTIDSMHNPVAAQLGFSETWINQMADLMVQMVPAFIVLISVYFVAMAHGAVRKITKRKGEAVPALMPVGQWMLPKSLVWYYLIAFGMDLFVKTEAGSMLDMILVNAVTLLMIAFAVQGVAFFFYLSDLKKWGKALPVLSILFAPFFVSIFSMIGLADVVLDIRKRMLKQ